MNGSTTTRRVFAYVDPEDPAGPALRFYAFPEYEAWFAPVWDTVDPSGALELYVAPMADPAELEPELDMAAPADMLIDLLGPDFDDADPVALWPETLALVRRLLYQLAEDEADGIARSREAHPAGADL